MRFIIDFKNDVTRQQIDQYALDNACAIIQEFSTFENIFVVDAESTPPFTSIVESVVNDTENPINLLSTVTVSTIDNADWWKIASANAPDLAQATLTYDRKGEAAIVYMVDSGIKLDHVDFVGANVSSIYAFNGDTADYNGHGTALASVIVGRTCGLTDTAVKSVKIFQDGTPTLQSHILAAMDAIMLDAASNPGKIHIANMSWVIAKNNYIEDKIRFMINAGIYVIASAGNNGTSIQDVTPASMPEVFTIGSYGQDFQPSDFSNFTGDLSTTPGQVNSGALDSWAPGENIRVALLDGGFGLANGTSVAAAIQSAALAFNTHLLTLSDGTVPPVFDPIDNRNILVASTGKHGILELTGQYASSVNTVSKFATEYDGVNSVSYNAPTVIRALAKSGVRSYSRAFSDALVDVAQIDTSATSFPEGISLDQNGWLIIEKTVAEPFSWTGQIAYTKRDGQNVTASIVALVIPENMQYDDASIDPEIRVRLQADCSVSFCDPDGCFQQGSGGNCVDACGVGKGPGAFCYCFTGIPNECP